MMKNGRRNNGRASTQPSRGYPRPLLQRDNWIDLNGQWDLHIDPDASLTDPKQVRFDRKIRVPFAPEAPLSGVNETGFFTQLWYRRTFEAPTLSKGQRLILHFGAVDYIARVWVNRRLAVEHEGGYTPFDADITDLLNSKGKQEIIVCAHDEPQDLAKPRGKQDWQRNPHSIWYYRTSGIWQTVWMEVVSATWISKLRWTPCCEKWEIGFEAHIAGRMRDDLSVRVRLTARDKTFADDLYTLKGNEITRQIGLADPGIDDYRNELLWYPHSPTLIQAEVELRDANGKVVDRVQSYTAMRGIQLLGNRLVLNGKPYQLHLVLNQGYWPDGGLTAPDDDAYRRDVELIKQMGFNGVRMHQKIEDPRFLYWADQLGLLVWEEMPSCYRFSLESTRRLTTQWLEAIDRDISHPCIIAWVPINESWGVPDLTDRPAQRNFIQAMYHLTKTQDPTRPVIGNDGWEAASTDIVAIHDYDADPRRIARRYHASEDNIRHLLRNERPGHKVLLLDGFEYHGQPIMLTEFGGIAYSKDYNGTWGYSRARSPEEFAAQYAHLVGVVRSLPLLAGFCYTQFTDTYQEANGLLFMDRTPKFPIEQIAVATRGPRGEQEQEVESVWRDSILKRPQRQSLADLKE